MKKIMLVILLLSSSSCTLALDILEAVYPEPNYMSIILHEERNYHNNLKPIEIEKIQMFKIEKIEDIAKIQKDIITQNPELQLMGTAKQSSQTRTPSAGSPLPQLFAHASRRSFNSS